MTRPPRGVPFYRGGGVSPNFFLCVCPPTKKKIFIDRDPTVFAPILNFLRTKELDPRGVSPPLLLHEAQFYGITPLGDRHFYYWGGAPQKMGDLGGLRLFFVFF